MGNFDYDKWKEQYYNDKILNLSELFTVENKITLKKLDIVVENKIYTKHEYEIIKFKILCYYKDEDDNEIELQYVKSLEEKNVNPEEFNKLINTIEMIFHKYEI